MRLSRCNKCVIELCYKSLSTVCVSNTDLGMTLKHRDYSPLGTGRYKYNVNYMIMQSNMTMMEHVIINGTVESCMAIYLRMAMEMP